MNSASNKLTVTLSNGTNLQIQVVHVSDPPTNSSSAVPENYCVIFEEGTTRPLLFRIAARSPFRIEQLDTDSPEGKVHWNVLDNYLKTSR